MLKIPFFAYLNTETTAEKILIKNYCKKKLIKKKYQSTSQEHTIAKFLLEMHSFYNVIKL